MNYDRERLMLLLVAIALTATLIGWVFGGLLIFKTERVVGQIRVLEERTSGLTARDVLCEVALELGVLHHVLGTHCETIHMSQVAAFRLPDTCLDYAPRQRLAPSAGEERK